eukprot:364227-Chlamydomonas_euryale.AAC.4
MPSSCRNLAWWGIEGDEAGAGGRLERGWRAAGRGMEGGWKGDGERLERGVEGAWKVKGSWKGGRGLAAGLVRFTDVCEGTLAPQVRWLDVCGSVGQRSALERMHGTAKGFYACQRH